MQTLATPNSLQALIDAVSIPMFVTNREHRYVLANQAACAFLGLPLSGVLGRTYADFFSQSQADQLIAVDNRVFETGAGEEYEEELYNGRGLPRMLLTRKQRLCNERGEPMLVGLVTDITAYREAEAKLRQLNLTLGHARDEADRANAAKSAFLALMSHEIRTPLNGVLGMAQAMAADELPPMQRDRLNILRESGELLLSIVNDVLDMSKIEAGMMELEAIEFDLAETIESAQAPFKAMADHKGIALQLDIEPAAGVYLGDPTRVGQVLCNLISNAVKFTPVGEVRVVARLEDDGVRLVVADTGIGMPPEAAANLFREFYQADSSTTRRFGGTGLGLAICRQLSGLMGGRIEADSREGEGTTMTVRLPLIRVAAPAMVATVVETQRLGQGVGPRVLVAEDNKINQLVLKTLLSQIGVEPRMVENGAQALEAWETDAFDLVLMDVQMPVMDGVAATRAIRRLEVETARPRTPIIALTANVMQEQVLSYQSAGMDAHVAKPIDARLLFERIEQLVAIEARPARMVA